MKFELKGVEKALRNIGKIAAEVSGPQTGQDAMEAVQPIVEDAQSLAPVDKGDLRDSIKSVMMDDGTIAVVIEDFKGVFYEFGTVHHRAQPMLAPAFDANEDVVIEIFGSRVGARIEGAV